MAIVRRAQLQVAANRKCRHCRRRKPSSFGYCNSVECTRALLESLERQAQREERRRGVE